MNVLVVFYSRYGAAEKLALAAGVGAIQARANIRLRRLADLAAPAAIEADPAWKENLARMNLDYVVPREADPEWAEVIVFASPASATSELSGYLTSLKKRAAAGTSFHGKIAVPFLSASNDAAIASFYTTCASTGFTVIPSSGIQSADEARIQGRRTAEIARAIKSSS